MLVPLDPAQLLVQPPVNQTCDKCPAKATVRFLLLTGDLVFCDHHTREYEPKIAELAIARSVEGASPSEQISTRSESEVN